MCKYNNEWLHGDKAGSSSFNYGIVFTSWKCQWSMTEWTIDEKLYVKERDFVLRQVYTWKVKLQYVH